LLYLYGKEGDFMTRPGAVAIESELEKQLNLLSANRDVRDSLDRGSFSIIKGKEHYMLYVLAKLLATNGEHLDEINEFTYNHTTEQFEIFGRTLNEFIEMNRTNMDDVKDLITHMDMKLSQTIEKIIDIRMDRVVSDIINIVKDTIKSTPVEVSGSNQAINNENLEKLITEVSDSYKVITQMRLLLNETHRRIGEISANDETENESIKLAVRLAMEESLGSIKERIGSIESRTGSIDRDIHGQIEELRESINTLTKSLNKHLDRIEQVVVEGSDANIKSS
jgi:hypothetical protein